MPPDSDSGRIAQLLQGLLASLQEGIHSNEIVSRLAAGLAELKADESHDTSKVAPAVFLVDKIS